MNTASLATTSNSATNSEDEMKLPTRKQMIAAARGQYQSEGEIEIDDNAKLSRAEGNPDFGAFVQAWVWVSDEEASQEPA
jgi:hypothetical protein